MAAVDWDLRFSVATNGDGRHFSTAVIKAIPLQHSTFGRNHHAGKFVFHLKGEARPTNFQQSYNDSTCHYYTLLAINTVKFIC